MAETEKRERAAGMPEEAALLLIDLYIRDSNKYHSRLQGGSKNSKTPRQQCLEEWKNELSSIGCDRTTEQIHQRLKGDLITIKARFTAEKAEQSKTGGGPAKKFPKLDLARSKLYEHLSGSHVVTGIAGGIESLTPMEVDPEFSIASPVNFLSQNQQIEENVIEMDQENIQYENNGSLHELESDSKRGSKPLKKTFRNFARDTPKRYPTVSK
uniref:Uncharacterized protein n=1 Tax=Caenorhabditis japonica TaxID=281687 RepID=A0A8R1HHN6_CAEJA